MYLFYERGIRGGQSVIFNKKAKANKQYMEEYNKDIETSISLILTLIIYTDTL